MSRAQRGYSLLEVVVSMAIFGLFLAVLGTVTSEMRTMERRFPISMMNHPSIGAVTARLRRDVEDTTTYNVPTPFDGYSQTPQTLLLYVTHDWGSETVVWDFTAPGDVHRKGYFATLVTSDWVAHGVPQFTIKTETLPNGQDAVRATAKDNDGKTIIDQIFTPRPHP